jgi:SAM-dependent methyltransferase
MSPPPSGAGRTVGAVGGLSNHRRDWEELGELEPLYAILSAADAKHGAWDRDAFLATGEADAARILAACDAHRLAPLRRASFELGCGVGRITRALSTRFAHSTGVDISTAMISRAREINADRSNCLWRVNDAPDLQSFPDGGYDLVLSFIVLQHVPDRAVISTYLREMVRILAPGGALIVQLPGSMPLRQRIQWRRRAYRGLRAAGVSERILYERLGLDPIRMNWLPRRDVEAGLRMAGATILDVQDGWLGDGSRTGHEENLTYVATR